MLKSSDSSDYLSLADAEYLEETICNNDEVESISTDKSDKKEDVRTELLETGKLKYNEEISNTRGLLSEPVEENTYTKKRIK